MDKYFKLRQQGFKIKFSKKNNKFIIYGSCEKIFLQASGENLEIALEKFYEMAMELSEALKKIT